MDFRTEIDKKGLKIKWVAEKIGCNYSSLRVYLRDMNLMPESVSKSLKELLK